MDDATKQLKDCKKLIEAYANSARKASDRITDLYEVLISKEQEINRLNKRIDQLEAEKDTMASTLYYGGKKAGLTVNREDE